MVISENGNFTNEISLSNFSTFSSERKKSEKGKGFWMGDQIDLLI